MLWRSIEKQKFCRSWRKKALSLSVTDMFGTLKNVAVPVSCLEKAMDDRSAIDLASLNGFAKEDETESYL